MSRSKVILYESELFKTFTKDASIIKAYGTFKNFLDRQTEYYEEHGISYEVIPAEKKDD